MDRWELHDAFLRTAETGSLSKAAKSLRLTQPAVSKRLDRLEKDLRVRLLDRGPRGVRLTEAGVRYVDVIRRVRSELEESESGLAESRQGLSGLLRVSVPVGLGDSWLTRIALRFQRCHPQLTVHLDASDQVVDLVKDNFDLGVRTGNIMGQSLSARALGCYGYSLVAAPSYLAKQGTPRTFEQLTRHPFYSYFGDEEVFTLPSGKTRVLSTANDRVRLVNTRAILTAVLEGAGIGRIANWAIDQHLARGELVQVLPDLVAPTTPVHAVFMPSRFVPERIRQFVAFLVEEMPKVPGFMPLKR